MKSLIIGIAVTNLLFLLSSNSNFLIYGQEEKKQQDDLVFNVQGLTTSPTTKDFKISGNVWEKICPSNQCQIEEDEYSAYVVTPRPEDTDPSIFVSQTFYVHDNVTNKDLTPLQKKFAERHEISFSCGVNSVKDIIEQANNTIYKCSGDFTDIRKTNPEENDPTYYLKVDGTYDTQSDTLNATGNYDRQYPP
jgi:hypothetical protein